MIISVGLRERADQEGGEWSAIEGVRGRERKTGWENGGEIEKMCEGETSRLIMCDN